MKKTFQLFVTNLIGILTLLANLASELGIFLGSRTWAVVSILALVGIGFIIFSYTPIFYFFVYMFCIILLFLGLRAYNAARRD